MESSDAQLEEARQALGEAEKKASEANSALQAARNELDRVRPFEKEVKEKNLLIGKLRHEAVTLNDHLTKALRFLKKGKPEDNVDRYVCLDRIRDVVEDERANNEQGTLSRTTSSIFLFLTDRTRRNSKSCSLLQPS